MPQATDLERRNTSKQEEGDEDLRKVQLEKQLKLIELNRFHGYNATLKKPGQGEVTQLDYMTNSSKHLLGWLALASFFATPQGIWCFLLGLWVCSGLSPPDAPLTHPFSTLVISTLVTSFFSISTFVPFAWYFDEIYRHNQLKRCQPKATWNQNKPLLSRSEVRLALSSLFLAAILSSTIVLLHFHFPGLITVTFDPISFSVKDLSFLVASTVGFFLWIDFWAYVSHRFLHIPFLYKNFHKWHHHYKQPTAFVALALHPIDMLIVQGGVFLAFFFLPLHPFSLVSNLLYVHYHNVVDHSGVYFESWIPWQPTSLFHDDHHLLFHVNYGQTLTIWDRVGGTFYSSKKKYTEKTFSW